MKLQMASLSRARSESGFTLVELMVAALVLVIGLLGVLGMLTGAIRTSAANNERVGATNLARELVEGARSLEYEDLVAGTMEAELKQLPNLAGSGSPWVVERRGVSYTITPSACVYDDPIDNLQAPAPGGLCSGNPSGATGDRNGDDFRRVTFVVEWTDRGKKRNVRQSSLIVNPSGGLGPRILQFEPDVPVISSGPSATFSVITQNAAAVNWATDDGNSSGVATGGPINWSISWPLGTVGGPAVGVVDGVYRVNAQAFDARGIPGDSKVASVTINRTQPLALDDFVGGHNTRLDVVDLQWGATFERDILGYRVYHAGTDGVRGGGDDVEVCPGTGALMPVSQLSCSYQTTSSAPATLYLVAVDKDLSNQEREGFEVYLTVPGADARPDAPTGPLQATSDAEGFPVITWGASPSAPLAYYRIYRGGTGLENRVGVATPENLTFTDSGETTPGQYYVTAVDDNYNESDPIGPVDWPVAP